jgi:hypothetical protein
MAQEHQKGEGAGEEGTAASRQPDGTPDEQDPTEGDPGKIRRLKRTRTLEARADFGIKYEFSIDKEQCHGYIIDV